ncbi:hypothetical protein [Dickeya oryzae]
MKNIMKKVRKTHSIFYVSVIQHAKLPFPFNELTGFSPFHPLLTTSRCESDFQNGERSHYDAFIHRQRGKTSQKNQQNQQKTPSVKAVNQNSNPELSRLSQKSVDNIV